MRLIQEMMRLLGRSAIARTLPVSRLDTPMTADVNK